MTDSFREPYVDARFNAATGLARLGNPAAVPVLLDMLDPELRAGLETETAENTRENKRLLVHVNGLRAVELLAKANPNADLAQLKKAVQQLLADDDLPTGVKLKAQEVMNVLNDR